MNRRVSMSEVATWDKNAVDEFLRKNRIYGCSAIIHENEIDGIGFLKLDLTSLENFGLIFMERCKIHALLNSVAPEAERKEFTRKWIHQCKASKKSQQFMAGKPLPHPPLPVKPPHLRPYVPPPAVFTTPPSQNHSPPSVPHTKPKSFVNKSAVFSVDEGEYHSIKNDYRPSVDDWEDEFSSGEFSECDEEPMEAELSYHRRNVDQRQQDPTSTPPPVPYRHDSSTSLIGSDRRGSAPQAGKVHFPPLPDPPALPKNRTAKSHTNLAVTGGIPQKETSPAREKTLARKDDLTHTMPWYFDVGRRDAERSLRQCIEGAFLVRPTQHGDRGHRYTMSIIFNRRVFHIPVRQKSDGRWALGSEKEDEETFTTVEKLVDEHRMKPINLHSDQRLVGTTCLVIWPSEKSF